MIGYGNSVFLTRKFGGGTPTPPFSNQYSMLFDGVDEYTKGSTTFSELDGLKSFSISLWYKNPDNTRLASLFSIGRDTTSGNFQSFLGCDNVGRLRYYAQSGSRYTNSNAGVITNNTWHHILLAVDLSQPTSAQRARIFVDGVDQTSGVTNQTDTAFFTSTTPIYIGEDVNSFWNPTLGNIDEFAMWVGTDQRSNAAAIYNSGVPFDLSTLGTAPDHWWRMGDGDTWSGSQWTLTDNIGSYDLTSINMEEADRVTDVPSVTPFVNQYSMTFDGVDEYFNVADNDNLSFGNGTTDSPFSISAWVKMTDATRFYLLSKGLVFSTNYEYLFNTDASDRLGLYLYDSSQNSRIGRIYNTALTGFQGQWIHICSTYNGNGLSSGIKLYLNGTQVDNLDSNSGTYVAMENGNRNLNIGRTETGVYANGLIDEVSIFNSELSASDVTTIYNSGTPTDLTSLSPLSWWRMGDGDTWGGSSWTLTDNGSGGNNATSVNMEEADRVTDVP